MSPQKQPNIVFIHAESMDGRKMGCMGHLPMRNATPNLDSLAESGTLFTNAYTNCPVCNPSRASMWTGKYPHFYECWNNHEGIRKNVPTFRTALENAGYRTAAIGPLDYQWGKHSIRDRVGSWTRTAGIHRPISRTPTPCVYEGEDLHGGDWENAYRAIEWMRESAGGDRPFMLYLTTGLVHPAFNALRRYMDRVDAGKIEIPPGLGDLETADHPVDRYQRVTKNCAHRFSERMVHQIRHVYCAMIAALDEIVGRIRDAVESLGLGDSTYVIFSSDHGEMAGEQNQILKRTMYEPSTHVPLIISGPQIRQNQDVDAPVGLVDMYPTLMDMAGLLYRDVGGREGWPSSLDGESLMPLMRGETGNRRDWVFTEYNGDRCCTGAYMLRRGPWKYVKYIGYESQLFNVETDPWESRNMADENRDVALECNTLVEEHFACEEIDARARKYDRERFASWRREQKKAGTYADTMAAIYSGFDRLCIEDIVPWTDTEEDVIEAWFQGND